jgi:Ca2+-binding RTX toxin-like protein
VRDPAKSKDVLYGGPGNDELDAAIFDAGDDVFYGGDDDDNLVSGKGEDVMYGGDGNDTLSYAPNDGQRDKLYCGKGKDDYDAEKTDYVGSSCEKKEVGAPIDAGP